MTTYGAKPVELILLKVSVGVAALGNVFPQWTAIRLRCHCLVLF